MVIELSTSPDILKLPAKLGFFSFASCGRVLKKTACRRTVSGSVGVLCWPKGVRADGCGSGFLKKKNRRNRHSPCATGSAGIGDFPVLFQDFSLKAFHPCALRENSCPSRVMRAQPKSGRVMCPMMRTSSRAATFSCSVRGTVKSSS